MEGEFCARDFMVDICSFLDISYRTGYKVDVLYFSDRINEMN